MRESGERERERERESERERERERTRLFEKRVMDDGGNCAGQQRLCDGAFALLLQFHGPFSETLMCRVLSDQTYLVRSSTWYYHRASIIYGITGKFNGFYLTKLFYASDANESL
jgi:hypothetical protein